MNLTHLEALESESIHILREAVSEARNPVLLFSAGKDSTVLAHLALRAFFPAVPPMPLLHIDSTWEFRELLEFRDRFARQHGMELRVYANEEGRAEGVNPFEHGDRYTTLMRTEALKQALDQGGYDVIFGGARRDEERSRAKERIVSMRNANHGWDPRNQRPELWRLYNCRLQNGHSLRVFPLSNWTELDIWSYIRAEEIPVVPLYFCAPRPVVTRQNMLIMVDDERLPVEPDETRDLMVRFRTLGCYPLTATMESNASNVDEIIVEMLGSMQSERQGRLIDHDEAASMERKKREGYF